MGVNTLAAGPANQPGIVPLLVQGRPVKAINQWYIKRRARLQATLPDGVSVSRQLDLLADKRQRQSTSYLHVVHIASRRIVDWLVGQRIGTLVIGKNDGWKHAIGLGKRINQTFVFVPHARFSEMLTDQADLGGIQGQSTEERDTSQASFLDGEAVPVSDPAKPTPLFSGRRVKRGLYRAADGRRMGGGSTRM
jgi:IS605 OrfB family transposase